ncbi:DNA-binding protein HU [Cellulomonas chitinilytica]|uniref:DNA-binding protein HU n=1 Tax=Cellulomonas chitinilytica TaxID=398759 RepID=A0A919NYR6_9CELL|nr:HU family DNA-binding protein [Cellulomonas chitinilytica]GIG20126.1 DNA-binding protein HU [Cellulomonas chitinilytica]
MVGKTQIVDRVVARGAERVQAAAAVDAVLEEITAALVAGERVTLVGFGTFEPATRGARSARNPRTGAVVDVPETTVARFRPGTSLRAAVAGGTGVPATGGNGVPTAPAGRTAKGAPATKAAPKAAPKSKSAPKASEVVPTVVAASPAPAPRVDEPKKGSKGKKSTSVAPAGRKKDVAKAKAKPKPAKAKATAGKSSGRKAPKGKHGHKK